MSSTTVIGGLKKVSKGTNSGEPSMKLVKTLNESVTKSVKKKSKKPICDPDKEGTEEDQVIEKKKKTKDDGEMLLVKKPKNAYLRFCGVWRAKIKEVMACEGMDADWRISLKKAGKPYEEGVDPPTEAVGRRCGEIWNSWFDPKHPQHKTRVEFEKEAEAGFIRYAKVKVFAEQCNEEARIRAEQEQQAKKLAEQGVVGFTHTQMFERFNAVIGDLLETVSEGGAITQTYTKLTPKKLFAAFQQAWNTQSAAAAPKPAIKRKPKSAPAKRKPVKSAVSEADDDEVVSVDDNNDNPRMSDEDDSDEDEEDDE